MCEAVPFVGDGMAVVCMFQFLHFFPADLWWWIYRHVADGLPSIRMNSVGGLAEEDQ